MRLLSRHAVEIGDDGGRYVDMHYHNWTPSHVLVTNAWNTGFNAIGTCNQVLNQFENLEDTDDKEKTVAEIKIMRAWFYYNMMDAYGNIPIVTKFDQSVDAPTVNFIEKRCLILLRMRLRRMRYFWMKRQRR